MTTLRNLLLILAAVVLIGAGLTVAVAVARMEEGARRVTDATVASAQHLDASVDRLTGDARGALSRFTALPELPCDPPAAVAPALSALRSLSLPHPSPTPHRP